MSEKNKDVIVVIVRVTYYKFDLFKILLLLLVIVVLFSLVTFWNLNAANFQLVHLA